MERAKSELKALWGNYLDRFEASDETTAAVRAKDQYAVFRLFAAFVEHENFHVQRNPARLALSSRTRLSLHQTEAHALHQLKAHIELLDAYRWHQISARRQEDVLSKLRDGGLQPDALLVQVDFKENLRYPLSSLASLGLLCASVKRMFLCGMLRAQETNSNSFLTYY